MKKIVLSVALLMLAGAGKAQDTVSGGNRFTLEDCLNYAFGNNYSLQSIRLAEEAKEDAYQQSKKERLPSLNASASENLGNDASLAGSVGLNANMTLYQGGNIGYAIEQSKLQKEQSSFQTLQYKNDLTVKILQAFLTALGNEELLKYQEAVAKASEEQMKQGEEQFRYGKILESDYLLLEAQYANDKNNVTDTKISRDNSLLTLKSLLSMPSSEHLQIISPDTASVQTMALLPTVEDVLESGMQTLPDLKISQYNIDISKVGLQMSKAGYLPTVSLNGSIGTGHSDFSGFGSQLSNRFNRQIGVSVSMPIFDNSRNKSKVRQSQIALQQAELDKKQTELDMEQTLVTEHQTLVSAYNKYRTTQIRQNACSKTFDVYRAQFGAGAITAVDLLQQQNNYISALNDYIQSKYEFILKRKIIDVYMGVEIKM
ncbi:MAG: TolC family protein [Bacteroidales bacterium]|jgi:outer membrane protein|nr:TolC family protein [Bacteroidales bacterium]